MNNKVLAQDIFHNDHDISLLLDRLHLLLQSNVKITNLLTLELIDEDLLQEIKEIVRLGKTSLYFGKTLRDMKLMIPDSESTRKHSVYLRYIAPKKLCVCSVELPYSPLQDQEYKSLEEVTNAFLKYISDLACYFYELERIDQLCTVMEPLNPSFKDDYRRILLDERTWLHVEVTLEGLASNIHLVGQSETWHDKLQSGLLTWDHDKDIVENIMTVFDIINFPIPSRMSPSLQNNEEVTVMEIPMCGICLCSELPDISGLPQPLCQSTTCGVHFHRNCLYQWLVACSGNRPPTFGVVTGACPTCLQPIACNEKDI